MQEKKRKKDALVENQTWTLRLFSPECYHYAIVPITLSLYLIYLDQ